MAENAQLSAVPGTINAVSHFIQTASATELAAALGFPMAFLVAMVLLFRKSADRSRVAVFITLAVMAAGLLAFVFYARFQKDESAEDKLARAIEDGCIPFEFDRSTPSIPVNLTGRFDQIMEFWIAQSGATHGKFQGDKSVITVEGYVEPLGTREYLLATGERRANSVKELLVNRYNAAPEAISTISYGKERDDDSKLARIGSYMCGARLK